jgi:hypothetical protein
MATAAAMVGACFFLASALLIACQKSPNLKTIKKPTTVPPHISINNGLMGKFQVPILHAQLEDTGAI